MNCRQTESFVGDYHCSNFQSEASHICSLLRHLRNPSSFLKPSYCWPLNRKDMK